MTVVNATHSLLPHLWNHPDCQDHKRCNCCCQLTFVPHWPYYLNCKLNIFILYLVHNSVFLRDNPVYILHHLPSHDPHIFISYSYFMATSSFQNGLSCLCHIRRFFLCVTIYTLLYFAASLPNF